MIPLPSWQIAIIAVLALALGVAIAIVATGIFLIALPIAVIAIAAYRLFGARKRRSEDRDLVIEGEYEVVTGARARPGRGTSH